MVVFIREISLGKSLLIEDVRKSFNLYREGFSDSKKGKSINV